MGFQGADPAGDGWRSPGEQCISGRRASRTGMGPWMLYLVPSAGRRLLRGSGTVLAKPGHDRFSPSVGSGGDVEGGVL